MSEIDIKEFLGLEWMTGQSCPDCTGAIACNMCGAGQLGEDDLSEILLLLQFALNDLAKLETGGEAK